MDPLLSQAARTAVEWMGVIAVTMILAASPVLRARKPVIFQYPRREGLVALGISALLILINTVIFTSTARGSTALQTSAPLVYGWGDLASQLGRILIAALPVVVALAVRRQPWLSVGLGRTNARGGWQAGLALALITIVLTGRVTAILNGVSIAEARYLVAMLAVGLVEETIFRGFIQMRLIGWLGELPGWLLASALYTVWHLPQLLSAASLDLPALALSLAVLFGQALLYGWIMRKSGSVLAPGLYHAVHNWASFLF